MIIGCWLLPVSEKLRVDIIKKGSEAYQYKEGPFSFTERPGTHAKGSQRCLTSAWFYCTLTNGTRYVRKWMIYSISKNKLYCFRCRLFASQEDTSKQFVSGFDQWWKLNPKVSQHESSTDHLSNLEKWKTLSIGLNTHKTMDNENQVIISQETKKWRNILYRLLDIALFLARQNLAFRGHKEDISSENRGNFLELVKLMGKYDPVLKEHCMKLEESAGGSKRVSSYLSKTIQNEFISLLGSHVKEKILENIKKAKYFGIIFDSTPDER